MLVNNFVSNTVQFLNTFAANCEDKLAGVAQRLSGIELALSLLEAKLDSVPGIADVAAAEASATPTAEAAPSTAEPPLAFAAADDGQAAPAEAEADEASEAGPPSGFCRAADHPTFASYFRLQRMGVPDSQIRLKMAAEGGHADVLSDPDRLVPFEDDA
ncbi:WASH complex, subunit CCDC53 [Pelagophyceae sp. CCMP2097]|nr:WASH complex, subunit CCDC53 [Pelagophyceae sp. CCMP2097]